MANRVADQDDGLTFGGEPGRDDLTAHVFDQPDAPDGGGRQDAGAVGFVVERHIARHDREIERDAGFGHALDAAGELAHDFGPFRVAEIHVVGDNEVYAPEDLFLSASAIEALPVSVPSQAQNLITYHQNYEPRLVLLSEYLEEFGLEMGSAWNVEQESYVFLGNHLIGDSRLPADHLFNFVITENEGDWNISGLLSE